MASWELLTSFRGRSWRARSGSRDGDKWVALDSPLEADWQGPPLGGTWGVETEESGPVPGPLARAAVWMTAPPADVSEAW